MKNFKKGFTLIELLVVIAIIGILASVVLASLNTARGKGGNSAVKSQMSSVRTQAEIFFADSATGYNDVCADTKIITLLQGASRVGTGGTAAYTCRSSADGLRYVAYSPLKVDEGTSVNWCVDSVGTSVGIDSARTALIVDGFGFDVDTLCN